MTPIKIFQNRNMCKLLKPIEGCLKWNTTSDAIMTCLKRFAIDNGIRADEKFNGLSYMIGDLQPSHGRFTEDMFSSISSVGGCNFVILHNVESCRDKIVILNMMIGLLGYIKFPFTTCEGDYTIYARVSNINPLNAKSHTPPEKNTVIFKGRQLINSVNIKDTEHMIIDHVFTTIGKETKEFEVSVLKTTYQDMWFPINNVIGDPDYPFYVKIRNHRKGTSSTYVTNGLNSTVIASIQRELEDDGEEFRKIEFLNRCDFDDEIRYEFSVNDGEFTVVVFDMTVLQTNLSGLVCIEKDVKPKPIKMSCLISPTEK